MKLTLRSASSADRPFVESVYFETQRWIIEKLFGWRGDDFEKDRFLSHYHESDTSIVVVDGQDAGWICVRQEEEALHLHSIYLLSAFQKRGIGTSLIRQVIEDARAKRMPLTVSTAKINPARHLYERLGFAVSSESEFKVFMEYRRRH
ncbi:MAG TPA: GNAT family N-acetyltransferase [Candidatus Baltobacteraceae bacterium]|jgi:ribosomal protein S18 acetylase RimI-like enzyme